MAEFKKVKALWYYGHAVSPYGQEHRRVDYGTLAKCFNAVLNNGIIGIIDDFVQVGGFVDNSDEIYDLEEQVIELENSKLDIPDEIEGETLGETIKSSFAKIAEIDEKIEELEDKIADLQNEQDEEPEIFQYYIVSDNAVDILAENNEIVFYSEQADMYLWGVTHWGKSWNYVLTDIRWDDEINSWINAE